MSESQFKLCHELQAKFREAGAACPNCGMTRNLQGFSSSGVLLWQCWKCAWLAGVPPKQSLDEKDAIYPAKHWSETTTEWQVPEGAVRLIGFEGPCKVIQHHDEELPFKKQLQGVWLIEEAAEPNVDIRSNAHKEAEFLDECEPFGPEDFGGSDFE